MMCKGSGKTTGILKASGDIGYCMVCHEYYRSVGTVKDGRFVRAILPEHYTADTLLSGDSEYRAAGR